MLLVAFATFSVLANIFRSTKESQVTLTEITQQLNDLSKKPVGSRNLLVAQLNDETAIIGFSKGSHDLELTKSLFSDTIGRDERTFAMRKPMEQCGEDSCVCYCDGLAIDDDKPERQVASENEPMAISCKKLSCIKGEKFGGLDLTAKVYNEFADEEESWRESRNGFFFHRTDDGIPLLHQARGDAIPTFETPPIMKGRFTIYLEKKEGSAAVCTTLIGGTCAIGDAATQEATQTEPTSQTS